MNQQAPETERKHHGAEMLLFLVVSVIGIYGLGQGLTGLFEPGQGINLLWVAVAGGALLILCAQMGRVQDTWPRRKQKAQPGSAETEASFSGAFTVTSIPSSLASPSWPG
jgi:hypothetical protein